MRDWSCAFDVDLVGIREMLVWTKTPEDAAALCDILADCGCTWPNGTSLCDNSYWSVFEDTTAYCINKKRKVLYGRRSEFDDATAFYSHHLRCTFIGVPDLVLPEEGATDYILL